MSWTAYCFGIPALQVFSNAATGVWASDGTCTGFEAVGPTGAHVTGVVGCGYFFKGCTVRIK